MRTILIIAITIFALACKPGSENGQTPAGENPDAQFGLGGPDSYYEEDNQRLDLNGKGNQDASQANGTTENVGAKNHYQQKFEYIEKLMANRAKLFDRPNDPAPWLAASYVLRTKTGVYNPRKNGGVDYTSTLDLLLKYVYYRQLAQQSQYRELAGQAMVNYLAWKSQIPEKGTHFENLLILEKVCNRLYPDPGHIDRTRYQPF